MRIRSGKYANAPREVEELQALYNAVGRDVLFLRRIVLFLVGFQIGELLWRAFG